MGHPENYRWSEISGGRFVCIRVNVELTERAVNLRRQFFEDNKVKIAPGISSTVYPPKG